MTSASEKRPRTCGDCDECCFALGVRPLDKPAFQRCTNQTTEGGCGIYETRPEPCRLYRCAWLEGFGEERDRPDRLGVVLDRMAPPVAVLERAAAGDAEAIAECERAGKRVRVREVRRGALERRRVRTWLKGLHRKGMEVQLMPFMGRKLPVGKPL